MHYGTEEQRNHYLPRLANGTDIPASPSPAPTPGAMPAP